MNIKVYLVSPMADIGANYAEFNQEKMGPEEWVACDFLEGWLIIKDRWDKIIAYPAHQVQRVIIIQTHQDRGS